MSTQVQVGKHLDLDQARVSRLIRDGILPPSKPRIGLDLDDCRIAYIRYLRGKAAGQVKKGGNGNGRGSGQDDASYSVLLEREKYREKKRENDLAEGILAPVTVLSDALEVVGNRAVPILESLPLQMKRKWPEITGDQITLVKQAIAEVRNEIADIRLSTDRAD